MADRRLSFAEFTADTCARGCFVADVIHEQGAAYRRVEETGNFPAGGGGRSPGSVYNTSDIPNIHTTVAGKRCSTSVVITPNKKSKGGHPTAKPVDLYRWLLERYCPAGGTVLDPTFGSCNSGRAAQGLGLSYVGIEMDPGFYQKARAALLPEDGTIQHV
jgi:DNA modification methylase